MTTHPIKNIRLHIKGLVQGVGFRPFVYRTALAHNISGWVKNRNDGVFTEASGKWREIDSFVADLKKKYPLAAQIKSFTVSNSDTSYNNGFHIIVSEANKVEKEITQIGPDIAVCPDCLEDMKKQLHRFDYPFINCTNCGPRFSILRNLPYDRQQTTMNVFEMCPVCKKEYTDPIDRRFHAQPLACARCGPRYKFISEKIETENPDELAAYTAEFIDKGSIVAIKGIGGFYIVCDAQNKDTVDRLRTKKNREGKPFAVMFKELESLEKFCFLNEKEKESLISWRRPITIVQSKNRLPQNVSNGIQTIGALLPYMPFHYLLFEKLKTKAIIFTSGNFSEEPILISNYLAETKLSKLCEAVLTYNREIYNRTDDSLLQVINGKTRLMRRSRGFVPNPVDLNFDAEGILATGAELKNTFCIGKGKQAILSQHIGDLKDFETYKFYEKNILNFQKIFRVQPKLVATDLHPEYRSTLYAKKSGLQVIQIQHHHAHIASAMVENGLDEKIIGVCFDGTGWGDDGNIWGSEFLVCDLQNYERKFHFEYIPLPGGDASSREPWRTAVSWLYKIFGAEFMQFCPEFIRLVSDKEIAWVIKAIDKHINCPLSSGAGRLFDAVSALLGLCSISTFEAEAPMRLENIADDNESGKYAYKLSQHVEFSELFSGILQDLEQKVNPAIISAKFHNTVSEIIIEGVEKIRDKTGLKKVVLSGGTFQNKYLTGRTEKRLGKKGFQVYSNCLIPCNDGGISLGQLAIAAKLKTNGLKGSYQIKQMSTINSQ